jgi:hypothetical protein
MRELQLVPANGAHLPRYIQPDVARQALHALRVPLENADPIPGQAGPLPGERRRAAGQR